MNNPVRLAPSDHFYKSVLIIGSGQSIPAEMYNLYKQKGYLLIGDGKQTLASLDLTVLKDRINQNTRLLIRAHGMIINGKHCTKGIFTRDFLAKLTRYSNNSPLCIHILSCYAGIVAPDVEVLPYDSVLFAYGENRATLTDINTNTIIQAGQDLSITSPIQDFVNRLLLNVAQTATISIKRKDGTIFQRTIRPPAQILTNPKAIQRHFILERSEFAALCKQANIGYKLDITSCPLTSEEAQMWLQNHLLYASLVGDIRLKAALKRNPERFKDYVNYQCHPSLHTALTLAVNNGHTEIVQALRYVPDIDPNLKDINGFSALIIAVDKQFIAIVDALRDFPGIDPNQRNSAGETALMKAGDKQYIETIHVLKGFQGIDPNIQDHNGFTALMRAVFRGQKEIVRVLLVNFKDIDLTIKNNDGRTALDSASDDDILVMLESYKNNPVKWLLENNADSANIKHALSKNTRLNGAQKQEIIILAAKAGKLEIIEQVINQDPLQISYLNDKEVVSCIARCLDKHRDEIAPAMRSNIISKVRQALGLGQSDRDVQKSLCKATYFNDFPVIRAITRCEGKFVARLYSENPYLQQRLQQYTQDVLNDIDSYEFTEQYHRLKTIQRLGGGPDGQIFTATINRRIINELQMLEAVRELNKELEGFVMVSSRKGAAHSRS